MAQELERKRRRDEEADVGEGDSGDGDDRGRVVIGWTWIGEEVTEGHRSPPRRSKSNIGSIIPQCHGQTCFTDKRLICGTDPESRKWSDCGPSDGRSGTSAPRHERAAGLPSSRQ